MSLKVGGWARVSPRATIDGGRVVRLVKFNPKTDTWFCHVTNIDNGRMTYKSDSDYYHLSPIDETCEPLLFLVLEATAGSFNGE